MIRASTVRRPAAERVLRGVACSAAAAALLLLAAVAGTQDADADGDTRTLTFFHTHRGDTATITFRRNGRYDEQALSELNWYLRDWRTNEATRMDPHLFDVLWEIYRDSGSHEPINIISSYRSPTTNAMLHHRSSAVSEHSQHMLGKAMDIRLPDVDTERLRALAMKLQYGGVGYYSHDQFVHVDTGNVRAWPRMSQEQLVRLFPNGRTLHLPSNGRPLAGYEEAKAEILPRNAALEAQASGRSPAGSIMTALFGRTPPSSDPASAPALQIASAAPGTLGTAPAAAPVPPRRPEDLTRLAAAEPPTDRTVATRDTATGNMPRTSAPPSIEPILGPDRGASVRAMFDHRTAFLDLGFSPRFEPDLSTTRFSGPAVQPLPVKVPSLMRQASADGRTGS